MERLFDCAAVALGSEPLANAFVIPMCPVCGEATKLILPMPETLGGPRLVTRACACLRAELAAEDAEREAKMAADRVRDLRRKGLASAGYADCTFTSDDGRDAAMRRTCKRYVDKRAEVFSKNLGMILTGEPGCGKTFWAAAIANAIIDSGTGVLMTTLPQMIAEMTSDYNDRRDEVLGRIRTVPFLILDDVGFERNTSFQREKAFEVIDERYRAKKPLIATTNLTKAELEKPADVGCARVYSRMLEMCPAVIEVRGKRREIIAREKLDLMREIMREDIGDE